MTSMPMPYCLGCKHLDKARLDDGRGTCAAYESGIPDAIWSNLADHRLPLPNDHGTTFAAKDDAGAEYVALVMGDRPKVYEGTWPGAPAGVQSGVTE